MSEKCGYKAMEGKKRELLAIAIRLIPKDVKDREALARVVLSTCVDVTIPETSGHRHRLVTVSSGGRKGGISRKGGNITLSWTNILKLAVDATVAGGAVWADSWLLPFVAIQLWREIADTASRDLAPQHAMTLLAMWESRDGKGSISEEKASERASAYLQKRGLPRLTRDEFAAIVDDLCAIRCVDLKEGVVHLIEKVRRDLP